MEALLKPNRAGKKNSHTRRSIPAMETDLPQVTSRKIEMVGNRAIKKTSLHCCREKKIQVQQKKPQKSHTSPEREMNILRLPKI